MMRALPNSMTRLIDEFSKMPGIGVRSAQRLAFYILQASSDRIDLLLRHIREVKELVRFCTRCNNLSEGESCSICSDKSRDQSIMCIVSNPNGVISMEKTGMYHGIYHVLLGDLSPIDGVGPDELKIDNLVLRVKRENIREVIVATDFTTEGETTALYLFKVLKSTKARVTRLARGIPIGASLEYADVATLQKAYEERK